MDGPDAARGVKMKRGDTYLTYMSPDPTRDGVKNIPIRLPGLKPGDMRRVNTERHQPSFKKGGWRRRTYHRSERSDH